MQTFKRFGLCVAGVALVVILASAAVILPWFHTPTDFHDQALRARLAGQLDTLIIGQSYAMDGIVPSVLDQKLGTRTYNLSGSMMPIYGQKYMVEKELARNPIRHVLIEITPDTFTSDERTTYGNGDSYVVARLDSLGERLHYMLRCVQPSDWINVYARILLLSARSAVNQILGRTELIDDSLMGYNPQRAQDVSGDLEWARTWHQSSGVFVHPLEENIREFEAMIESCKRAGCEVTLVYTPVSHAKIWQLYDQDVFLDWARGIAKKHGVPLFDFNLLRDRYSLFNDYTSFSDDNHLSEEGAHVFTTVMAEVLHGSRAGGDMSPYFYDSYRDVIRDSVYWGR